MRKKNPFCSMCGVVPHPPLTRYCRDCKKLYMRSYRAKKKIEASIKNEIIASQSGQ